MKKIVLLLFFLLPNFIMAQVTPAPLFSGKSEPEIGSADKPVLACVRLSGYGQLWYLYEQNENDKQQPYTNDKGDDVAAGFSLNKAQLNVDMIDDRMSGRISLGLEKGSVSLLDFYGNYNVYMKYLVVTAGQMKIPSTYEVAIGNESLDFATRSRFSTEVTNWALSKSVSSVSPFTSVQTNQRDAGAGVKGELLGLSYFLMAGNGLGAGMYVGNSENKGFVTANKLGAHFYAGRVSYQWTTFTEYFIPLWILTSFETGGHYSYNNHQNIIYNDGKSVLDLKRKSWSVDARMTLFERIRLTAMMGKGIIEDDFDNTGKPDYKYSGSELKCVIVPIKNQLEFGFRYDVYKEEKVIFGGDAVYTRYTAGATVYPCRNLSLMANYMWKRSGGDLGKELDDDIFILSATYRFQQ